MPKKLKSYGLETGFTLVEILIYTALIGIAGVFLNGTLVSVLRLQSQETSSTEVNQQINFVLQNIQKSVRDSSLIDMTSNVASSTLTLRMEDPTLDKTLIYLSGTTIYIKKGTSAPLALTTTDVNADQLQFTRVSSYPGHDSVSVNISLSYNTQNSQKAFSTTLTSAVARVNAATFDSDILPGTDATYNVGSTPNRWQDLNLSRNLVVGGTGSFTGNVGIGTASPTTPLQVAGTIMRLGNASGGQLRFYDGTSDLGVLDMDNSSRMDFYVGGATAGNLKMSILSSNGNVGIGTTNPLALLHISGANQATGGAYNTYGNLFIASSDALAADQGGSLSLGGVGNIGSNYTFARITGKKENATGGNSAGYLAFETDANSSSSLTEKMRITSTGSVGIGTASPGAFLHINKTVGQSLGSNLSLALTDNVGAGGGSLYQIGFGYQSLSTDFTPAVIGFVQTSGAGHTIGDLIFATRSATSNIAPSEVMRIDHSGNVGIGTASPGSLAPLQVTSPGNGYGAIQIGQIGVNNGSAYLYLAASNAVTNWKISTNDSTSAALEFAPSTAGGGVTWAAPTMKLTSTVGTVSFAAWTYNSDRRLKENISYFDSGLSKITRLQPAKFDYINGAKNQLGFIAQDVQKVIPEAVEVTNEKTGMLGLKTEFIVPYLVNSTKELNAKIEDQQKQIDSLISEVSDLKTKIK